MKLFILLIAFSVVLADGDLSVPANASKANVGNFSIAWAVTPLKTIIFNINHTEYGYFGFSYMPSMIKVPECSDLG